MMDDRMEERELLFPWKKAKGTRRRLGLAVVIALVLFAIGGTLFTVRGRVEEPVPRKTASFVLLSPTDERAREVLEWAGRRSPFQEPWEMQADQVIASEIAIMEAQLRNEHRYEPSLWPLPSPIAKPELPKLFDLERPELPPVERIAPEIPIAPSSPLLVVTSATGSLLERWKEPSVLLDKLLQDAGEDQGELVKLLGEERFYEVGVDHEGTVIFCQMRGGSESRLNQAAGVWLRRQQVDPKAGAAWVFGTVKVQVVRAPQEEE